MNPIALLHETFVRNALNPNLFINEFATEQETLRLQESFSMRNVLSARALATYLIDERGKLQKKELTYAIAQLSAHLHSLGPDRHHDSVRTTHQLTLLKYFQEDPAFEKELMRISSPKGNQGATTLIRHTLLLKSGQVVRDGDARAAVLTALLTHLRQNVGSCFATAPAILISHEQPLSFLDDMGQLLGRGQLIRVINGQEYTVPLSVNWGMGQLLAPLMNLSFDEIALSPSLHHAFSAAKVLKQGSDVATLLRTTDLSQELEKPYALLNVKIIIEKTLLAHFNTTIEEVERHQRESFAYASSRLLTSPPKRNGSVSKYLKAYGLATLAFKALTDCALLKSWEFTLASLSEVHADFAKWNLYASLGMHPSDQAGIGQVIHRVIDEKIHECNEEIKEMESKYDHLYAQAKYMEGRMQRASEQEGRWLAADYRMRQHELNRVIAERDQAHDKARRLSQFYTSVIQFYTEQFKLYFQEVYDAEMHDISAHPYDDSPAGFRLLYKHGRSNPSAWTLIHTEEEFVDALAAFFVATEIELSTRDAADGLKRELSALISAILTMIKRPEFLEQGIYRLAKAYGEGVIDKPHLHLGQVSRKPWSYISGGTMATLIACYYHSGRKPKEASRWVESETELLVFYIDTIKEMTLSEQKRLKQGASLLAFSPTHAFSLQPSLFADFWDRDEYTYTWVRDEWSRPACRFLDEIELDRRAMDHLLRELGKTLPEGYRALFANSLGTIPRALHPSDFRSFIINALSYQEWLQHRSGLAYLAEELDSLLFKSLPFCPEFEVVKRVITILDEIQEIDPELQKRALAHLDEEALGRYHLYSAEEVLALIKTLLIEAQGGTRSPYPLHDLIVKAMQRLGFAYPAPILVGDTNWVNRTFGFTVSPSGGKVELWCFDACGGQGRPLSLWKPYLNGTSKKEWGIYTEMHEYGN